MKKVFYLLIFLAHIFSMNVFSQVSLKYTENTTPQWNEVIQMYSSLADKYAEANLIEAGTTDVGKALHLFIISKEKIFSPEEIKASKKQVILINNGIHPGESNGIDASLEFADDILAGRDGLDEYLENTIVLIIPIFNVGGALNRSAYHRANQNGPELQGFRGNARNLDLNRDFVKMDSRNSISLVKLIQSWDPDIFIDTHSTNGADYPYTLTIIPSHHQQMEKAQSKFLRTVMEPTLFERMNASPYKMCQYVNIYNKSPENGFEGFFEYPRYLAGYTSTFQILSFTIETHMLKPYAERVLGTKYLLGEFLKFTHEYGAEIRKIKQEAINASIEKSTHVLHWYIDTTSFDIIPFNGYTAKTKKSKVSGMDLIYYDQSEPWSGHIRFYNYFKPNIEVESPDYYILPAAWNEVVDRLKWSNVEMHSLKQDTSLSVETYYIEDFQTGEKPYNGHYLHYASKVRKGQQQIELQKGDYIIPVKQRASTYLVHTLEPQGYDSFFNWNFFDEIIMRMEYFSPYLFDETANNIIEKDPVLKKEFTAKKEKDAAFAESTYAQLKWIYERSEWSEKSYRRYPVFRLNGTFNY